jgi:amino acid transporter
MKRGNSSTGAANSHAPLSASESPPLRDYGLKSATLSPMETLAQSISVIAPICTPVMTIPLVFGIAGEGCAIAYLISTVTILLVALNINQFARTSASPGSLYTYIAENMHSRFGMIAGWALSIAYLGTAASVSAGVTNYADVIVRGWFGIHVSPLLVTVLTGLGACWLAYRDVQISARLMLWLQVGAVALITFVALSIVAQQGWRPDLGQLTLRGVSMGRLRMGLVLAIFSSVGFESATALGSEAQDPLRNIPRAVKWSAILAGLFFFLCAYAEVLAFRGQAQTLDVSPAPLHVLVRQAGLPAIVGTLTDLGAVASFFTCVLACITAAARLFFLMGRNGALHALFGEAHETNQTPHRAVVLSSIVALLPACIMTMRGMSSFLIYGLLGALATFGFLTAYILVSAAAPIYLRMRGLLNWRVIAISGLAVFAMGVALFGSIYPVPPAPYSVLPYIYAGLLVAGFAYSVICRAHSGPAMEQLPAELGVAPNKVD